MTISIYKAELEKKTWEQFTDEGKKLTCRNSFCEKHGMQQKEKSNIGRESGPIKPVVKTDRSEVKSQASLTRDLGVSSRSEEEDGWGRRVRMKLMPNDHTVRVCSLKTTTFRMGSTPEMSKVGTHSFANYRKGAFLCDGCKK